MLQLFKEACLNLIYPPLCLHCSSTPKNTQNPLCEDCLEHLILLETKERCPICFENNFLLKGGHCYCADRRNFHGLFDGVSIVFEYLGPAASLVQQMKYSNKSYLAKGCGAYLAAQFLQMDWPMPDCIIPVPISWTHLIGRGYNQSLLLAEELGSILHRPVIKALKRRGGDYSQAGLSRKQRLRLNRASFFLNKLINLETKNILLIDDVLTTGSTLRRCAEALAEGFPQKIYSLVLCHTEND